MAHKRRKNILKQTKGYINSRSTKFRAAKEAVLHAGVHSFRGRKLKKRTFRALWQAQINAACRQNDLTYSKFIAGLKKAKIEIDRKILAQLAEFYPEIFKQLISRAK